jgi:hypothetical protein
MPKDTISEHEEATLEEQGRYEQSGRNVQVEAG